MEKPMPPQDGKLTFETKTSAVPIGTVITFSNGTRDVIIQNGIQLTVNSNLAADKIARYYSGKVKWKFTTIKSALDDEIKQIKLFKGGKKGC
jgi:hypothetical protein